MAKTDVKEEVVTYSKLQNGIHEFVFHESSRRALDQWIAKLEEIYRATPEGEIIRSIYDQVESGMQPAAYASRISNDMLKRLPHRNATRTVFLVNKSFFISIMESFVRLIERNTDKTRFIDGEKRDEAIAWLLADD
jgi:hypothetical protein